MNQHFSPSLLEPNPREVIGGNYPPAPSPIDLAKEGITALSDWLADHPVIENQTHAHEIKPLIDRLANNCADVERERVKLVTPLNEQLSSINKQHKAVHNTDKKGTPGIADKVLNEAKARGTAYLTRLEQERIAIAQAAAAALVEAEAVARELDRKAQEAALDAKEGVCTDVGAAISEADAAFAEFERRQREADRADAATKVRLTGGSNNSLGLRERETLTVTDWKAAITDMLLDDGQAPEDIREAIVKCARAYRKENHELPAGVTADYARAL